MSLTSVFHPFQCVFPIPPHSFRMLFRAVKKPVSCPQTASFARPYVLFRHTGKPFPQYIKLFFKLWKTQCADVQRIMFSFKINAHLRAEALSSASTRFSAT